MKVKFWIDLDPLCYDIGGMKYKLAHTDPSHLGVSCNKGSQRYTFEVEFPDLEAEDLGLVKAEEVE